MKKYFLIAFVSIIFINNGFAQSLVFPKPSNGHAKKLTAADSLSRHSDVIYNVSSAVGESYTLSANQSETRFLSGSLYNNGRDNYLQVQVTLTNNSANALKYLSMSCSWWDIYITNNKKIKVLALDACYKNSPIVCVVPPHQSVVKYIIVLMPKEISKSVIFKVGMILEKTSEDDLFDSTKTNKQALSVPTKQNILWSNYISVGLWRAVKK